MKKFKIKQLILVAAIAATQFLSLAQTPFDSFAPSATNSPMLALPEADVTGIKNDSVIFNSSEQSVNLYSDGTLMKSMLLEKTHKKFINVDPMADKYPGWGPYVYCMNNPVSYWDPNGETVYNEKGEPVSDKGGAHTNYYQDSNGEHLLPSNNSLKESIKVHNKSANDNNGYEYTSTVLTNGNSYNEPFVQKPTATRNPDNSVDVMAHGNYGLIPPQFESSAKLGAGGKLFHQTSEVSGTVETRIHSHPMNAYSTKDQYGGTVNVPKRQHTTKPSGEDEFGGTSFGDIITGFFKQGEETSGASFFPNSGENFDVSIDALNAITEDIDKKEEELLNQINGE